MVFDHFSPNLTMRKDSNFPFPWRRHQLSSSPSSSSTGGSHGQDHQFLRTPMEPPEENRKRKSNDVSLETQSPRLKELSSECQALGCIQLRLCDLNASAGRILSHATRITEALFKKEEPLIFKFGFSHNPVWRWTNSIYGYCHSREKWTHMIILHYSKEPFTTAMLEAALIEKYQGAFAESIIFNSFNRCFLGKRKTKKWTNIFRIFCWDFMPVKVDPDVRTSSPAVTQWSLIWLK